MLEIGDGMQRASRRDDRRRRACLMRKLTGFRFQWYVLDLIDR